MCGRATSVYRRRREKALALPETGGRGKETGRETWEAGEQAQEKNLPLLSEMGDEGCLSGRTAV